MPERERGADEVLRPVDADEALRPVDADEVLRPVDLARLVGVSTQQIRNYAAAGILPAASRTGSGYRRFGAPHRQALLTFRALMPGFGGGTAREIMRALHQGETARALALVDEAHAGRHEQRLALRATAEALQAVAGQETEPAPRAALRIGEVAARLGVRTSALRVWEAAGLLTPRRERGTGYRVFGPADVRDARMIDTLRRGRYRFTQIRPVIEGLRESGSSEALRAAVAQREAEVGERSLAMLTGAAALRRYVALLDGAE